MIVSDTVDNQAKVNKFTQMANTIAERNDRQAQSLKEQALEALEHILKHSSSQMGAETIRHALSKLSDDF